MEELFLFGVPLEGLHVLISRKSGGNGLVGSLYSAGGILDVPLMVMVPPLPWIFTIL